MNETEKYKDLYEFSKEIYKDDLARFVRIDEKASRYLSVLTIVIGIVTVAGKWILEKYIPPETALDISVTVIFLCIIALLLSAWLITFRALKNHELSRFNLDEELLEFFQKNKQIDIYNALSVQYKDGYQKNYLINAKKSHSLAISYKLIISSILMLVLLFTILIIDVWSKKHNTNKGATLWQTEKIIKIQRQKEMEIQIKIFPYRQKNQTQTS